MFYSLTIIACLVSAPTDCRNYDQPASGLSANPSAAYVEAQSLVVKWIDQHPGLTVKSWRLHAGQDA